MSTPIRRELDVALLAARERRLRLVLQILGTRDAEYRRQEQPTPPGLQQSIADFGRQLGEVRRRQAEISPDRRPAAQPGRSRARTNRRVAPHRVQDLRESS